MAVAQLPLLLSRLFQELSCRLLLLLLLHPHCCC